MSTLATQRGHPDPRRPRRPPARLRRHRPPPTGCCGASARDSPPSRLFGRNVAVARATRRAHRPAARRARRRPRRHRRGGRRRHPSGGTAAAPPSPATYALGAVDDLELTRAVAAELGRRLAACGVNLNWAPVRRRQLQPGQPRHRRTVLRRRPRRWSPGTPPPTSTGLQSAGVAACVKHFPGHGDTAVDSHHALPRIDVDLDTLHARDLLPFRAADRGGRQGRDERAHPAARARPGPPGHPEPARSSPVCCASETAASTA